MKDEAPWGIACGSGHFDHREIGLLPFFSGTHARLTDKIPILKPLLDQLVRDGFRLDPAGTVYRDALARVDELP